ncbi:hypothetical protein [Mycolicibacterium sp.]|uniref:hypothetical protein n=1 Tax=Mycolicibacterium sp. TaxID=2320850 RepID=UPI0037C667EB
MAREHARIWLDINSDEHFQTLSFDAQGFYTRIILTEATLNYCGVADWRPKRLTTRAADLSLDRILTAAGELERENYLLFDLDTEEVLARSYIRRDELIRNPKMAATVIKSYAAVASPVLRAAIVTELKRIHDEHPEYSSWTHKDTADGLARLLSKPALGQGDYAMQITYPDPVRNGNPNPVPITYPDPVPIGNPDPVRNTEVDPGADNQSKSVRIPSTSTNHHSPAPLEGYVSTEGNQEPSPRCPSHQNVLNPPKCPACADARRAHEAWEKAQKADEVRHRRAIKAARTDCPHCDSNGLVETVDGMVRCTAHDEPEPPAVRHA